MSGEPQGNGLLLPAEAQVPVSNGMRGLNQRIFAVILGLTLLTLLFLYLGLAKSGVDHPLLPAGNSVFPWKITVNSDGDIGGTSSLKIHEQEAQLGYEFFVTEKVKNPYATLVLSLAGEPDAEPFVDFSQYSELTFNVRCSPRNVLTLILSTFSETMTKSVARPTYPIPSRYFSCDGTTTRIAVDLRDLEIPDWWFQSMKIDLSERDYSLRNVTSLAFGISAQSPRDINSSVTITELALHGRDWRLLYGLISAILPLWICGLVWILWMRSQAAEPVSEDKEKNMDDRVPPTYRKLDMEPQRDRQKNAILQLMATEYANPDMSVEMAVATLGVNRNKINEVLRQETGLTFTGYLNKLKLTEAARLLAEKESANIAEIAYSVGYNNVSHFNKLFKNEYGCTPKAYKMSIQPEESE